MSTVHSGAHETHSWLFVTVSSLVLINNHVDVVDKGAVCLDETPSAYYYFEGCENGAANWIVFLEGGGWCNSGHECSLKSLAKLRSITFTGLLDNDCTLNSDFCNWNKVYVHYCDGSSLQSDVQEVDLTIGQAAGDWYFNRSSFDKIDTQHDRPLNCTLPVSDQCFYQKCLACLH